MKQPKIPLSRPYLDARDERRVLAVLRSGQLSMGPEQRAFEDRAAKRIGTRYAAAVSSGTAGLHLSVRGLGLGSGDEVITTPFSFIASSNCLLYENVTPVFVDVDDATLTIAVEQIERRITKRTKAILPVHVFGQMADMKGISRLARKHGLAVIEDACEALGASRDGIRPGVRGDAAVFGFYPNKQITTGEGGLVATNSKRLDRLVRSLRNQGRAGSAWLEHRTLGYNYRLDDLSAALGAAQLEKFDEMQQLRRQAARRYSESLSEVPGVRVPETPTGAVHGWFVYVIRVPAAARARVLRALDREGIQAKPYLSLLHLQPFMKRRFGFKRGDFPVAEQAMKETIALPFFPGISHAAIKKVSSAVKGALT